MNKRIVMVDAPTKINLGLEVVGKRDDGFHEIRSVFHGVELADRLAFSADEGFGHGELAGVAQPENLITRAIEAWNERTGASRAPGWTIEKSIPMAAGLGGGSSDAAATLRALEVMSGQTLPAPDLSEVAAGLGSDVPFFLGPLAALVGGRGEAISPSAGLDERWTVILLCPDIAIPNKTARLYGLLKPGDFSDGSQTESLVVALASGEAPMKEQLGNAFSRALYELVPGLAGIPERLTSMGFGLHGLSGAGPTHYVLLPPGEVDEAVRELEATFDASMRIIPTALRSRAITAGWSR